LLNFVLIHLLVIYNYYNPISGRDRHILLGLSLEIRRIFS